MFCHSRSFIVEGLKQQNKTLEVQSAMLGNLPRISIPKGKIGWLILIGLYQIHLYTKIRPLVYPMISSLIMPNTNISWDMTMRFNA